MTSVCFFYMMVTCVTLSSLRIHNSESRIPLKTEIWYYPLSILVLKIQDLIKQNRNWHKYTIHKITERIESNKILEVTDDEGAIYLLINLKFAVIREDTNLTLSRYATLHYHNTRQSRPHTTTFSNTIHPCVSNCFYTQLCGDFNPTPK